MSSTPLVRGKLYKRPDSERYYMDIWANGVRIQKSTGETDRAKAEIVLTQTKQHYRKFPPKGNKATTAELPDDLKDYTVSDLRDLINRDYQEEGNRSLARVHSAMDNVSRASVLREKKEGEKKSCGPKYLTLGTIPVMKLKKHHLESYKEGREAKDAAPATIKNELAILRRGLNLFVKEARERGVDLRWTPPAIPKLNVDNVREVYLALEDLPKLLKVMPDWLKGAVEFAYFTGARKGEVFSLLWNDVDMRTGRLIFRETKNKEPREITFGGSPEIVRILERQRERQKGEDRSVAIGNYVFPGPKGRIAYRKKTEKKSYRDIVRRPWKRLVKKAGFPDLLFHDFRRSAITNMERAGVPRSIAMSISGHKTESVYNRYSIADEKGQRIAFGKITALRERVLGPSEEESKDELLMALEDRLDDPEIRRKLTAILTQSEAA